MIRYLTTFFLFPIHGECILPSSRRTELDPGVQDLHRAVLGLPSEMSVPEALVDEPKEASELKLQSTPASLSEIRTGHLTDGALPTKRQTLDATAELHEVPAHARSVDRNTAAAVSAAVNAANAATVAANTAVAAAADAYAMAAVSSASPSLSHYATASSKEFAKLRDDMETAQSHAATYAALPPASTGLRAEPRPVAGFNSVTASSVKIQEASGVWAILEWYSLQASLYFTGMSFMMFIKALCILGNVLVQVSPFPVVMRWESRGDTGEADSAPYVSIAFSGCQWCFYGIFAWLVTARSGFLILVHSNCLGAMLGMFYVAAFFRNCHNDEAMRTLHSYLSGVLALSLLQLCALSTLPVEKALFLVGICSSFCSFVSAASVLVTVPAVLKTKDSRSIPGPFCFANFASSFIWTVCGYMMDDACVTFPNIFATLCAAVSLALKVKYPHTDKDVLQAVEEGVRCDVQHARKQLLNDAHRVPAKDKMRCTPGQDAEEVRETAAEQSVADDLCSPRCDATGGTC